MTDMRAIKGIGVPSGSVDYKTLDAVSAMEPGIVLDPLTTGTDYFRHQQAADCRSVSTSWQDRCNRNRLMQLHSKIGHYFC